MRGVTGGERERTSRAQSETIGMVLILSMTLVGATVAVAVGSTVINDAQADSNEENIRNAMTQLDSRAARVALGDSTSQRVTLARGTYRVDADAGWINVTHINHTGDGDTEVVYNDTLGAIVYEGEDRTIAYQGGGVWETTGNASTMISPPEFHYRGATLTLPIIRIIESASASGPVTAEIRSSGDLRRIYPNESSIYNAGPGDPYQNPVSQGNVSVRIHSTYYQAWAEFFRTRSDGDVTVFHNNETVEVLLFTPSSIGAFDMPAEGNGVNPSSVGEDHPVTTFEITLKPDPNFNNMHWAFYADEGGEEFELHIHSPGQCSGDSYNNELDVSIYYYNGTGSTYEGWQNTSVSPNGPFITVDCDAEEMRIDFLESTPLAYDEISLTGGDNKWFYGDQISGMSVASNLTLDEHPDVTGEPATYSEGTDSEAVGFLVNHYLQVLGPSFELKVTDGPGGSSRVDEGASSGILQYDKGGGARFITFLHITENRVTIELD